MKRIISILLVTALLIGMIPVMVTAAADTTDYQYAVITSENGKKVRMRGGPSKAYDPIDSYPVGTTVIVLQNGLEWSQIQIGDVTGWMMSEFLIFGATGGGTGSGGSSANAWVISDNGLRVWLRATAGGKRLFLNAEGTPVTVLDYDDDWCRVSINGIIGYMMTEYIGFPEEEKEPAPEPPKGGRITSVSLNYQYPTVLDTLSVTTVPADAIVKYSWQVYGENNNNSWIERGNAATFEVLQRYAGCKIRCVVTGVDPYSGSATATSEKVQISRSLSAVSLNNTKPVVGDVLKAVLQPSSAIVEYSWRVGGVEVSDAEEYLVQESDIGKIIQLKVSGISGYSGSFACSAEEPVASDKELQSVTINDSTPVVGQTLSAAVHPASASVDYEWTADGAPVGTGSTYKVSDREIGKKITLTVKGKSPYTGTVSFSTENVTRANLTAVSLTSSSPSVGDTIYATVSPSGASAKYTWHIYETGSDNDPIIASGESSSLKVPAKAPNGKDIVGKQIFVVAEGIGTYNGIVSSGRTGEVLSGRRITGVSLNSKSPIIGDYLTAKLSPDELNESENAALKESFTYVWEVGTEKKTGYGSTYQVQENDKGKQIRVRVIGTGDYANDVYSSYTNAVGTEGKISGVKIINLVTGADARYTSPEVGHRLEARVQPETADPYVTYAWFNGNGKHVFTGKVYEVTPGDYVSMEGNVSVKVTPNAGSRYTGSAHAYTSDIEQYKKLVQTLAIPMPVAGEKPVTSLSKKDVYSASIAWIDPVTESVAAMDQYGNFKPNTAYTAKITISPDSDYTLFKAEMSIKGTGELATQDKDNLKIFYYDFPTTGVQNVNNFYIADLDAPVVTASGTTELDTICSNDQLHGVVTWEQKDAPKYVATVTLYPKPGYTLNNLPENVFKVNGADSCVYEAGTNTLTVTFELEPELYITANKTEIYQDYATKQIVHLIANARNCNDSNLAVEWKVINPTTDATTIYNATDKEAQLVVGAKQLAGTPLIIEATWDYATGKDPLKATLEIPIIEGDAIDTALNVVFVNSPAELTIGKTYNFSAYVENSMLGCTLYWVNGNGSEKKITNDAGLGISNVATGSFTWEPINTTALGTYIIRARAIENEAIYATLAVNVHESFAMDDIDDTINYGQKLTVTAGGSAITVFVNGEEIEGNEIDTTKYNVGDTLTIKAVSNTDSTLSDTDTVMIIEAGTIAIKNLDARIKQDYRGQYKVTVEAEINGAVVDADEYSVYVNGDKLTEMDGGSYTFDPSEYTEGTITVKAQLNDYPSVADTQYSEIILLPAITLEKYPAELEWGKTETITAKVVGTELDNHEYQVYAKLGAKGIELTNGVLHGNQFDIGDEIKIYAVAKALDTLTTQEVTVKIAGIPKINFEHSGDWNPGKTVTLKASVDGYSKLPGIEVYIDGNNECKKSGTGTVEWAIPEDYGTAQAKISVYLNADDGSLIISDTIYVPITVPATRAASAYAIGGMGLDDGMGLDGNMGVMAIGGMGLDDLDDPYANVLSGLSAGLDSNISITGGTPAANTTGATDTNTGDGTGATDTNTDDGTGATDTNTGDGTGATDTNTGDGTGATDTNTGDGTGATDTNTGDGTGATDTNTGDGTGATDTNTGDGTGAAGTTTAGGASVSFTNSDGTPANITIIEEDDDDDDDDEANNANTNTQTGSSNEQSNTSSTTSNGGSQNGATGSDEDEEGELTEEELAELENASEDETDEEAVIKVDITKAAGSVGRGRYSTYEASVTGTEKKVRWSVHYSVEGASSIDQSGVLTIGEDEEAEELTVIAYVRVDGKLYHDSCKVAVVTPSNDSTGAGTEGQNNTSTTGTEGQSNTSTTGTEGQSNTSTTGTEGQSNTSTTGTEGQSNTSTTGTEGQSNASEGGGAATEEGEAGPSAKEMEEINQYLEELDERIHAPGSLYAF